MPDIPSWAGSRSIWAQAPRKRHTPHVVETLRHRKVGSPLVDAFAAHVLHQDGFVEIALIGELDVAAAEVLRETVLDLPARYDADQVVFNCVALHFIDFYGVHSLLELGSRFGGTGRLTLRYLRQQAKRVLEVAGATDAFRIDEDLAS